MSEDWTRLECEAIVADYFAMLVKHLRGEPYNKTEHRNRLMEALLDRSKGSIEYKHQNITAVLLRAGRAYIPGYKPAWNYQTLLGEVVLRRLSAERADLELAENQLSEQTPAEVHIDNVNSLFVKPPAKQTLELIADDPQFKTAHFSFSEREARNRRLGQQGEEFVLRVERTRLESLGRSDLASEIEWTSREKGDGAGYDVRSFDGVTDRELFIEVKTTNSGKYQPFMISAGEVAYSDRFADRYSIYRVFDFSRCRRLFALPGRVSTHVHLDPKLFRAHF